MESLVILKVENSVWTANRVCHEIYKNGEESPWAIIKRVYVYKKTPQRNSQNINFHLMMHKFRMFSTFAKIIKLFNMNKSEKCMTTGE